jgi:flavin-dependent dehydrogenase
LPYCYFVLKDLGVLEEVKANSYKKPGVTFSNIDGSIFSDWCFGHVIPDESYMSFHVRRAKFDDILLRNSERHGVEVWEETKVTGVDLEGEKAVVSYSRNGEVSEVVTRFVIDASGQSTFLANRLQTKKPFESLHRRLALSTHWVNTNPTDDIKNGHIKIVHLEGKKLGWLWMIPIEENRTSVGLAVNMDYAKERQREYKSQGLDWKKEVYLEEVMTSPVARQLLDGAEMANDIAVNGDFSYYSEKKYGKNYGIIGDASAFLDPVFSSGIYLGIKGAQLMVDGLEKWLNERDDSGLEAAYKNIQGAYRVIEELIATFYTEGSIRFAGADRAFDQSYEKFEKAYSILHLILAGDFFENHEKYLKAISMLKDAKMIEKYKHLIKHPETENVSVVCQ